MRLLAALTVFAGGVAAITHHDRPTLPAAPAAAVSATPPLLEHPSRSWRRPPLPASRPTPVARRGQWTPAHDWVAVARCESGGRWHIVTPPFYGGLQFTLATWRAFGGHGWPQAASRREQIRVAERVLLGQGPGAWPICSRYLEGAA